jgi:hypothetical protein
VGDTGEDYYKMNPLANFAAAAVTLGAAMLYTGARSVNQVQVMHWLLIAALLLVAAAWVWER